MHNVCPENIEIQSTKKEELVVVVYYHHISFRK